jgi:2-polyprenyl-3-methyl-5-hydroxy-6-metoxy-1,4-benzoquinol methylase
MSITDHSIHDHTKSGSLSIADRHEHEAEVYDRMARDLLATLSDDELKIDLRRIPFPNREHVDYLTYALGKLGPLSGKRILEVGVGGGTLAAYLAGQGADVTGIDVSSGILELAAKRAAVTGVEHKVRLVNEPIETFRDEVKFDGIIGNNVLHHFDLPNALANIGNLLAPGAPAVFCEPVLFVPEAIRSVRYSRIVSKRFPPHTHTPDERSLDKETLRLIGHHFATVNWTPFHVTCRLQHFVELSDRTWNRLEKFDRSLLHRIPAAKHVCRQIVLSLSDPLPIATATSVPAN